MPATAEEKISERAMKIIEIMSERLLCHSCKENIDVKNQSFPLHKKLYLHNHHTHLEHHKKPKISTTSMDDAHSSQANFMS